ncbi:type II toxin-antitoxin system RatA family toxin [Pseudobdellovibrio exovorus]|uniref:Putative polyketide cyclase n=1 Tax=Pseudobdellovibrio exovorus JSS TaxID=1184267 RepID=M4V8Q7_9BACT|nr:SRPBCC family protein [Pseudobdellovibrio exovorus]AGH95593.1 putative polyketide cyclase [Pseudobdellovibrio exovorus JSS]
MASANTKEVFNCTAEEFFKIVTDYEKYSDFLPEVKSVKVYKNSGGTKEMEYHVSLIKTFKYKLKANEKPFESVKFEFIGGDVFKTMKGEWTIKDQGDKCAVDYNVEATFGMFVPESMAKPLVSANLPMMMTNFRKRIKELYGK